MKNQVRSVEKVPKPKRAGIIRKSHVWKEVMDMITKGQKHIEVKVSGFEGITQPLLSFTAALRRHNAKFKCGYEVYTRDGFVYLTKKGK
jgi:hypothetical protein